MSRLEPAPVGAARQAALHALRAGRSVIETLVAEACKRGVALKFHPEPGLHCVWFVAALEPNDPEIARRTSGGNGPGQWSTATGVSLDAVCEYALDVIRRVPCVEPPPHSPESASVGLFLASVAAHQRRAMGLPSAERAAALAAALSTAREALTAILWRQTRWPFADLEQCPLSTLLNEAKGLHEIAAILSGFAEESEGPGRPTRVQYLAAAHALICLYLVRFEEAT